MNTVIAAMVAPTLFYAGTAAAAIPILIHLFNRRRFRRIRWAATDFLLEAQRRNRRRVRIEELILLALRCLAMFLLGSMLARFFMRPEALASVLGSTARTERIIVLDDSFSMGLARTAAARTADNRPTDPAASPRSNGRAGNGDSASSGSQAATVFEAAKAAVARLVPWVREESPHDSLTLLVSSQPDRPAWREPVAATMDERAFNASLESLAPSFRAGNMTAALTAVGHILDENRKSLNTTIYIVSDFQQIDWTQGPADNTDAAGKDAPARHAESASPAAMLAGWAEEKSTGRSLRVVLVDVGLADADNLSVTTIEPQQAQVVRGVPARYTVKVANLGDSESEPQSMRVYVGDAAQPAVGVPSIGPRRSAEVPIEITCPNEGSESLTVEIPPDRLPVDNTRTRAVPVARAVRILVINGEASSDLYQDEAFLLTVALRPEGTQFSGNEVTVVEEGEFEAAYASNLSAFHVIVLANVYRISEDLAARLEEYVSGGGGLAVFLGDQVDPDVYNRILYRDGQGVLPAKLGEIMTARSDTTGVGISELNFTHPAMRRFQSGDVSYFDGVLAWQYFACRPAGTSSIAPASGPHAAATNPATRSANHTNGDTAPRGPAQVLMRFADGDHSPAIIERTMGKGRACLITTSADKEWTNLPDRPVFLVLAMELVQYLARQEATEAEHLVGQPIVMRLDPARFQPTAMLKTPAYPAEPPVRVDAQTDTASGTPSLHWMQTAQSGLYRFELTDTAGTIVVEHAAVNVDTRESDLRHADRTALLQSMPGLDVEYISGDSMLGSQDAQAKQELWPAMLIALVAVLMIEHTLAWWFGADRQWSALWRNR